MIRELIDARCTRDQRLSKFSATILALSTYVSQDKTPDSMRDMLLR